MGKKITQIDHPGSFIQEELEARGWQQVDLAYILGWKPPQLHRLLSGEAGITPDTAVALGDAFDMPPEFFLNLQKQYELQFAKAVDPGVRTRAHWLAHFPVREMIKRGWIEETEASLLDLQMLRFFGKNRVEDIPFIGSGDVIQHAAKKTAYDDVTSEQYVWLHRVIKIAAMMDAPLYSEQLLRKSLPKIRAHLQDKDDLIHIPSILRQCGVKFVLVEALPGGKIDGVCVWPNGQPAIGMSLRLDRLDNFAFVLRHECEHVLQGDGKENLFSPPDVIEGDYETRADAPIEEKRANDAAADFCVPGEKLHSFIARKAPFISEQDVLGFAARTEIHPAIVIGQIQHKTQRYAWLRKYQTSIRNYLLGWEFRDGWGHAAPSGL